MWLCCGFHVPILNYVYCIYVYKDIGLMFFSLSGCFSSDQRFCLCPSEAQPVYIGVPASHRRKRRRHHSYASDADRDTRHAHYDHHTHREHSHRGYYHDQEEQYDDDEGSAGHQEQADPSG